METLLIVGVPMMKDKVLAITVLTSFISVWPDTGRTQHIAIHHIGFLSSSAAPKYAALVDAFRDGLRGFGYEEGKNITIEFRWADDDNRRLPGLASNLVNRGVEVIVTQGTPATRAAENASQTLPIVMAVAGDAVATKLVASIARPGGNVTGNTFFAPELAAKRLDLLKEAVPGAKRIAVIVNPANPISAAVMQEMTRTAAALKLELAQFQVTKADQLKDTFVRIGAAKFDGVAVFEDGVTIGNAQLIARLAIQQKLPLAGFASLAKSGALIGYGADIPALFRRAAYFVDMILKGKKPADLPVERAERFRSIINLKTANALNLTPAPALLVGADEVLE